MASVAQVLGCVEEGGDGLPGRRFEGRLTFIRPAYPMRLAWAPGVVIRRIRCHRAVGPSLSKALELVLAHYGSAAAVKAAGLDLFGGCYVPGDQIAGALTLHAFGAAIRLDPAGNPPGKPWAEPAGAARGVLSPREGLPMMPPAVVEIFAGQGWLWGGHVKGGTPSGRPDCAQFQFRV